MEDSDEPYLDGIKYHAMPPMKRFRDMEHLSGGEKTMAALALLFAVHSYQPSPFFVLDEVDAALDNANVARIANYIQVHAGPGMQFIVISLKTGLFQSSEALVGIYRDQSANSSKALTLDVSLSLTLFFYSLFFPKTFFLQLLGWISTHFNIDQRISIVAEVPLSQSHAVPALSFTVKYFNGLSALMAMDCGD